MTNSFAANPFAAFQTLDNINTNALRKEFGNLCTWMLNLIEATQEELSTRDDTIQELKSENNVLKAKLAEKCLEK